MLIFAHRGASGEFPENTLTAFEAAITQHCDGIELDVFQAGDELVVYHDRYLDKLGYPEISTSELTPLARAGLLLPDDKSIPTLLESLQHINGRCLVNIEVKFLLDVDVLLHCLDEAVRTSQCCMSQFILSSFDHTLLRRLRQARDDLQLAVLLASVPLSYADITAQIQPYSVHLDMDCVNEQTIRSVHQLGLPAYVYTVDRQADIRSLLNWQADGIFTNYPKRSRKLIEQCQQTLNKPADTSAAKS